MTNSSILQTPGQLLANIPGILGFYPSDSIVLMAFEESEGDLTLGPTLRFDIADLSTTLTKALTAIDHHRCVFIMPFAITSSSELVIERIAQDIFVQASLLNTSAITYSTELDIERIAQDIFVQASLLDMPIIALWHTAAIADGEPFAAVERDLSEISDGILEIDDMPSSWKHGNIDRVVTAATMEPFIRQGRLPGYDRDEAHAPLYQRNHIIDADTLNLVQSQALHAAAIMQDKDSLKNP